MESIVKNEFLSDLRIGNVINSIINGTITKCGEVYISNNAEFLLNCSLCDKQFEKVYTFCKHILKDHKEIEIYQSIDIFCNNNVEIVDDEENSVIPISELSFLHDNLKEFKTKIDDADELPILMDTNVTNVYNKNEKKSIDSSAENDDDDPLEELHIQTRSTTRKQKIKKFNSLFECPYCEIKFKKKLNLRKHVDHKHNIEISDKTEQDNIKVMEWSSLLPPVNLINENILESSSERTGNDIKLNKNFKINCKICGKETPKHKLSQHLRSHDYSRYTHKCNECGKLFISEKSLDIHVKNLHLKEKPFVCKFDNCNRSFVTEHALTAHQKLHSTERPYQCLHCLKEFLHKSKLTYHIKVYHDTGKILNCDLCDKQFFDMYTLEKHKVCYHIDNIIKIMPKNDLDNVQTIETNSNNEIISKFLINSSRSREEIQNLNNNSQNLSYCEKNEQNIHHNTNDESLLDERKRRPGTYECIYCELKFIYKSNLREHINRKHNDKNIKNNENLDTSESNDCGDNVDGKKKCKKIRTKLLDHRKSSVVNQSARSQEKLICDICGKETVKYKMVQHLRSHDNTRYTHKCETCEKLFISDKSLQIHMKNYHLKDRPFACTFEHCNKTFATENALTAHHILHTSERPFKCSICQKGFVRKSKMEYHIKTYHVNGRIFKCDECGKRFYEIHTLQVHKICHSNEKPFACDECPARFPRERSLAWHKQSHSGVKPYICKVCGKEYALYNGIYSHMKTHGIKYSLAFERGEVNIQDLIDTALANGTTINTTTTIQSNDEKDVI